MIFLVSFPSLVIGQVVKDGFSPTQQHLEEHQFTINIERLDSIFDDTTKMNIILTKMDAQGFECNVLQGMGGELAKKVGLLKFEYETRFLRPLNCMDLVERVKDYGFDIYRDYKDGQFSSPIEGDHLGVTDTTSELYALRKR